MLGQATTSEVHSNKKTPKAQALPGSVDDGQQRSVNLNVLLYDAEEIEVGDRDHKCAPEVESQSKV
jgi:hypothetical protein